MDENPKKDLTGLFQLTPEPADHQELKDTPEDQVASEKVESFESLDQIGMMDHPEHVESEPAPEMNAAEALSPEPALPDTVPLETMAFSESPAEDPLAGESPALAEPPPADTEALLEPIADTPMDHIRIYSEQSQEKISNPPVFYPFHLHIEGKFGPFEQDKLLLFITENQIGITSGDLTIQIRSGRVFFPRISEFAAIKLIQEMRDSGLSFRLNPSDQMDTPRASSNVVHYENDSDGRSGKLSRLPVIPADALNLSEYQVVDSVKAQQYVKAEIVEFETSELLQEVIERMTEALKRKAEAKGGHALTRLQQTITPLRLPSQYQVSLEASVLKKST